MAKEIVKNPTNVNEKNIYITFIIAGVIAWFPLSTFLLKTFDFFEWLPNPKILGIVELSNFVAAALCAAGVFFLVKSKPIYDFTNDVFIELSKVSWPIKKGTGISTWEKFRELRESTAVVIMSIVLLSVVITGIDVIYRVLLELIF